MLDAQLIASTLLNPQKNGKELKHPGLSFIFKQLFPGEKYKKHDAMEDARATFKVYSEVTGTSEPGGRWKSELSSQET